MMKRLAREEGLLVGISGGGGHGRLPARGRSRPEPEAVIVTVFPDCRRPVLEREILGGVLSH